MALISNSSLSFWKRQNAKKFKIKNESNSFHFFLLAVFSTCFAVYFWYRRFRLSFSLSHFDQKLNQFSENAFYYSFFVDVTEAGSFKEAFNKIIYDNRSEHPNVINAFCRFNIFQEFFLGLLWRICKNFLFFQTAWNFYTLNVLILNGMGIGILTLLSATLGGSVCCGFCTLGFYFANIIQRLVSRLSAVSLRENFGLPFLWLNILLIVLLIKINKKKENKEERKKNKILLFGLFLSSFFLILVWQFGVFILTTQCASIFAVLLLGYDVEDLTKKILKVYVVSYISALFAQCFPKYLLLSFFPHMLLSIGFVLFVWPIRNCDTIDSKKRLFITNIYRGILSLLTCFFIRLAFSKIEKDDSHVFQLLLAKLHLASHTFDTKIYLMGGTEFNFFAKFMYELLLPSKIIYFSIFMFFVYIYFCVCDATKKNVLGNSYSFVNANRREDDQLNSNDNSLKLTQTSI